MSVEQAQSVYGNYADWEVAAFANDFAERIGRVTESIDEQTRYRIDALHVAALEMNRRWDEAQSQVVCHVHVGLDTWAPCTECGQHRSAHSMRWGAGNRLVEKSERQIVWESKR